MNTKLATIILVGLVMLAPVVIAKSGVSRQQRSMMLAVKKDKAMTETTAPIEPQAVKEAESKLTARAKALVVGKGRKLGLDKQVGNKPPKTISAHPKDYSIKSKERYQTSWPRSTGKRAKLTTVGNPRVLS